MTPQKLQTYALTLHFTRPRYDDMIRIKNAHDANQYMRDRIDSGCINHKEYFWMIITTQCNRVLGYKEVSSGTTNATAVPFKEIAQVCLLANASGCIVIHNHPSGNLKPSNADHTVTKRVSEVLNLIEVELLDHLIITQEGYYSFADDGLITPP